MAAVMLG